jgi:hypothetical protein
MAASVIWVKGRSAEESLIDFAEVAISALGLTDVQERQSSNFRDGHYYAGVHDGSDVELYFFDDVGREGYLFEVHVDPCDATHAETLALLLARRGRFCFVPTGAWYLQSWDGQGTAYAP